MKTDHEEAQRPNVPMGIRDRSSYLPALESLRGVAILLVFFFHADGMVHSEALTGTRVSAASAFVHAGHTGVTLFFVLSAFLLSRPYWQQLAGGRRVSPTHFFRRRALRILPLYWFVVVASSVIYAYREGGELLTGVPYLFFLNSFSGAAKSMFPFSDVWWSLATEAQFYLLLPVLGALSGSRVGRQAVVVIALLYAGFYGYAVANGFHVKVALGLSGRLPAFAIGAFASWLVLRHGDALRRKLEEPAWLRNGGADAILFAVLFAQGLLLREVVFRGFYAAEATWHGWHVAEAWLWTAVVLLVLLAPLRVGAVLSNAWLGLVGRLSYSLYLVHMPILFYWLFPLRISSPDVFQGWNATSALAVATCLALALALSALTYWAIERPFLRSKSQIPT